MSYEAASFWKPTLGRLTARQIANVAGWIREHQGVVLFQQDLAALTELPSPTAQERAEKLLLELQRRTECLGQAIAIHKHVPEDIELMAVSYSTTPDELAYLATTFLAEGKGFVKTLVNPLHRAFDVIVTAQGYSYLEDLKRSVRETVIGFCAMWFDPEMTPVWTNAIERAIGDAGYEPKRVDRHEHNNRIDDEIIALLRRSRFVVADFTQQRGGVYFEAGFALGLGRPVVWTVREDELAKVHFDTRQYNFIVWRNDELDSFRARLQSRIEATLGRGPLSKTE